MVFVDCGTITAVYPFWFFLLSHCSFYCKMESSTLWSNERVEETKWVLWFAKTLIKLFYRTPLVLLMPEDGFCGLWYCSCGLCFLVFP
jgi:hypothetical protein